LVETMACCRAFLAAEPDRCGGPDRNSRYPDEHRDKREHIKMAKNHRGEEQGQASPPWVVGANVRNGRRMAGKTPG